MCYYLSLYAFNKIACIIWLTGKMVYSRECMAIITDGVFGIILIFIAFVYVMSCDIVRLFYQVTSFTTKITFAHTCTYVVNVFI